MEVNRLKAVVNTGKANRQRAKKTPALELQCSRFLLAVSDFSSNKFYKNVLKIITCQVSSSIKISVIA